MPRPAAPGRPAPRTPGTGTGPADEGTEPAGAAPRPVGSAPQLVGSAPRLVGVVPRLVGVGMGPGDPELVTVKAVRVLGEAHTVVVPVLDTGERGRAEATVLHHVPAAKVERVVFALNEREDRTRREAAWDAAAARVTELLAGGGGTVAFATIGDPAVYSTFTYLAQTVRAALPGTAVETVPGITAMQDLAARSGTVLAEGTEPLVLIPATADPGLLDEALAGPGTVVAYKFGRVAPRVAAALRAAGRDGTAVYGAALGLPDEQVSRPGDPLPESLPYLSTLISPAPRTATRGGKL